MSEVKIMLLLVCSVCTISPTYKLESLFLLLLVKGVGNDPGVGQRECSNQTLDLDLDLNLSCEQI